MKDIWTGFRKIWDRLKRKQINTKENTIEKMVSIC